MKIFSFDVKDDKYYLCVICNEIRFYQNLDVFHTNIFIIFTVEIQRYCLVLGFINKIQIVINLISKYKQH